MFFKHFVASAATAQHFPSPRRITEGCFEAIQILGGVEVAKMVSPVVRSQKVMTFVHGSRGFIISTHDNLVTL